MSLSRIAAAVSLSLVASLSARADQAATFFDDAKVREVRLTFADANWYQTLYNAHANDATDPYFPARFEAEGVVLEKVGVRFKGNSSFRVNGVKKSFKIDFNEYSDDLAFLGLKKLNLNNLSLSPDFMREKLTLDFAGKYIAAMRAVHVRLYVNGALYGLYMGVEQPDKTMMKSRFGDAEDGNLYEAGESNADLTYLGTNASSYASRYELKTNETANDYSGLIELLDVLDNTATASLPAAIEPICDVENMLYGLALDNLFSNVDSYIGSASEFYLYDRTSDGKFVRIHWDLNESFGTTGDGSPTVSNPMAMDPFWLPSASSGGPGGGSGAGGSRPLASRLWAVDVYRRTYLRMLARFLREGFDPTAMTARVNQLAALIRDDVKADPNKLYTTAQFENALTSQTSGGQVPIYGLGQFVSGRYASLRATLNGYALASDVRLNELVTANAGTYGDAAGDADPWLEIQNLGPGPVTLTGFTLTDDAATPKKWTLPARTIADGGFLVVWLDGETGEGDDHASFRPSSAGGTLWLYVTANGTTTLLDTVTYPALVSGQGLIRTGSSGSTWSTTGSPTPGATNASTPTSSSAGVDLLRINEVMANNDSTIVDPDEPGAYEDWIEIYNPGSGAVDMSGLFLTDDLASPTKWQVPSGVTIPAGGYLLFWADGETAQGSTHANFKLSADGEAAGLTASDGKTVIDSVTFGAQGLDVAYGRYPNATGSFMRLSPATPGAKNQLAIWVPVASHGSGAAGSRWRTDLGVLDTGSAPASISFVFHGADGATSATSSVAAGGQGLYEDVVALLGGSGSGALEVRSDQPVRVTSRTYNLLAADAACTPGGTLGLDVPSLLAAEGLQNGQSAWLTPLAENGSFRTNVALTNTGTAKASATVALYDGAGTSLGTYAVDLAAGEWKQEDRPFASRAGRTDLDRAYAKVTVTAGSGVTALASVIDNLTNDPTSVSMKPVAIVATGTTPGTGVDALRINELMADNGTTIVDPAEAGAYEDWVEIVNTSSAAVDMSGLYLSDDLTNPTKWKVPTGVSVPGNGSLLFWADGEESQGSTHASWKLSADGEAVALTKSDGTTLIDSVTFGALAKDVSYGRLPDATGAWTRLTPATPAASNRLTTWVAAASHGPGAGGSRWRTDLGLLGTGTGTAHVELRFHGTDAVVKSSTTVAAGTQALLADVVDLVGAAGSGALEVVSDQPLRVSSRTYDLVSETAGCTPGGTLGLDVTAATSLEGLAEGESAYLPALAEDAAFRTNIALTNTGTAEATVTVTLFDGAGTSLGSYDVRLAAGEWKQDDRPFANRAGRNDLARAYARVTVTSGSGVVALASVIDDTTNDPTAIPTSR